MAESSHKSLTSLLEDEIQDADEGINLGFVDPSAHSVDVTVGGRDHTIHQSPSVLSSNRAGGTTGAVLWKVSPLFASWLASPTNILFTSGALTRSSAILELGCGISTLNALALSPRVARYILTDQPYVHKLVQQNLSENLSPHALPRRGKQQQQRGAVHFTALDWETDEATPALTQSPDVRSFDAVVACDCVFNYALVQPFVQACVDVCRLRSADEGAPCLCVVAQQLRNDEVFQSWLETFCQSFHAWRVPDAKLPEELRSNRGFVVHIGILRDASE